MTRIFTAKHMNPDILSSFLNRLSKYARRHRILAGAAVFTAGLLILFFALNLLFPLPAEKLEKDYSVLHLSGDNSLLRITLSPSGKYRIKTPLNSISEYMKKGIITYEDRFFYFHPGINPYSVLRAVFLNLTEKRIVSGASTITLQVAKLIEPRERTFGAKLIESFRALQLEFKYSKDEILEIYLNLIPMGGNIEGVEAASYLYFNKPASRLNLGEAALLIALPKHPNRIRPDINPKGAKEARAEVLSRIKGRMGIGEASAAQAAGGEIPESRYINPYRLPHLVNRKLKQQEFIRHYNIDGALQSVAEELLKNTVEPLKEYGVFNGAVLIVENAAMKAVAYAGSPDFGDKEHAGEIDGINIYRSPGSTLKPFIYGLAVEKGVLTPKKIVYDIPWEYDGYSPVNFDRNFKGPVTAEEALAHSYNAPAVHLEYSLGKEGLFSFLKRAGCVDYRRRNTDPGLAVALGSHPLTLEEIVMLYCALANGGELKRINYTAEGAKQGRRIRMLSPETSYIITDMISKAERPDLPQSWEFTSSRGKVAFKTGTSFGYGNAWCIGYNPDYTVGVWLGNADAAPSFKLIGIKSAAPLMIEIFNHLTRYTDSWFKKPEKVKKRKVCAVSGDVPGYYCKNTAEDYYIEGKTLNKICSVHKQIYIDRASGKRVSPLTAGVRLSDYEKKIVEEWPVEAAFYLRKEGGHLPYIPPYKKGHVPSGTYLQPRILSPVEGSVYFINSAIPGQYQKIPLRVAAAGGTDRIIWLLKGRVVAEGSPDKILYLDPEPGEWEIVAQDSTGESDSVKFRVVDKR